MGRKCCVPNCRSGYTSSTDKVSLFKLPNAETKAELFAQWRKAVSRKDRQITDKDCVCEKHFREDEILRVWEFRGLKEIYKHPRLKPDAVPSVFPVCSKHSAKNRTKAKCCVPNCLADSNSCNQKLLMFKVPNSETKPELFSQWKKAVSRTDRQITNKDLVCGKHFQEDDIIRVREFKGRKVTYRYPKLKTDAIPSVFPKLPECLLKSKSRTTLTENYPDATVKEEDPFISPEQCCTTILKIKEEEVEDTLIFPQQNHNLGVTIKEEYILAFPQENCSASNIFETSKIPKEHTFFSTLWKEEKLPFGNPSWTLFKLKNAYQVQTIVISSVKLINQAPVFEKQIILHDDDTFSIYVQSIKLPDEAKLLFLVKPTIDDESELKNVTEKFDSMNLCQGGPCLFEYQDVFSRLFVPDKIHNCWRHRCCKLLCLHENNICDFCKRIGKPLQLAKERQFGRKTNVLTATSKICKNNQHKSKIKIKLQKNM